MKMVICFDTEDPKGMENTIKTIDHLAKEYVNRRVSGHDKVSFGKIEFIKAVRQFASEIARAQGLDKDAASPLCESEDKDTGMYYRQKEDWEGLRFAKLFADRVFEAKRDGKLFRSF
jgi:hypothetical protein